MKNWASSMRLSIETDSIRYSLSTLMVAVGREATAWKLCSYYNPNATVNSVTTMCVEAKFQLETTGAFIVITLSLCEYQPVDLPPR